MDYQALGQTLSALRQQNGVSQQTLANHLDISRATINALENNRSGDIGIRKVMKILDYLGKELAIRDKSPFPTFEELRDGQ
jgi:transcriptional regulator with XRE-family HTH domain